MIVRAARPDEARRLVEVRMAGWQAAYAGILHPDVLRDAVVDQEKVARQEAQLADPAVVTLVAELTGRVVAVATLCPARDGDLDPAVVAELAALYVDPDRRGGGLGSALLEAGFARLPQPEQVLWVLAGNAPARRFYAARGFAPDGGRQVLPMPGDPVEVRYRRISPAPR